MVLRPGRKLGIIQLWFKYFGVYFWKHWACTFLGKLRREMPLKLVHHSCLPFYVWEWTPQFANLSVLFQNIRALDTHESAKEVLDSRLWALQVRYPRSLLSLIRVLKATKLSTAVVVASSPKCTSCVSHGLAVTGFKVLTGMMFLTVTISYTALSNPHGLVFIPKLSLREFRKF